MPRFKLTVEYAGTRFSGWQIQKNARTVAGESKIDQTDLLLYRVTDDPAEAVRIIIEARTEKPGDPKRILG